MEWRCPLCETLHTNKPVRFCDKCCVFPDEVLNASPAIRRAMALFCRRMAKETGTKAALAQAATWERACR
jgi:hypothetical protein